MPQPAEVTGVADPLVAAYRRAWERVVEEQQKLLVDPMQYRRRARLVEVQRSIESALAGLDSEASAWVSRKLPTVYGLGGAAGSAGATGGPGEFLWSQIDQQAVQTLATKLFDELLTATEGVTKSTKALVRAIGRDEALQAAIAGNTARQAGREMARVIEANGIHSIQYANGAKHGLAEYSEMVVRTTTAQAYNLGSLGGAAAHGVTYWEIFDGPYCGLSYHNDPTLALGMIVDKLTAQTYLIAHPNCRRSFGPRPDVTTADAVKNAERSATRAQRDAQVRADAAAGDPQAAAELAVEKARVSSRAGDARTARVKPPTESQQEKLNRRGEVLARRPTNDDFDKKIAELETDLPDGVRSVRQLLSDNVGWTRKVALEAQRRERLATLPSQEQLLKTNIGWTRKVADRHIEKLRSEIDARYNDALGTKVLPKPKPEPAPKPPPPKPKPTPDELKLLKAYDDAIAHHTAESERLAAKLKAASGGRVRAKVKLEIEQNNQMLETTRAGRDYFRSQLTGRGIDPADLSGLKAELVTPPVKPTPVPGRSGPLPDRIAAFRAAETSTSAWREVEERMVMPLRIRESSAVEKILGKAHDDPAYAQRHAAVIRSIREARMDFRPSAFVNVADARRAYDELGLAPTHTGTPLRFVGQKADDVDMQGYLQAQVHDPIGGSGFESFVAVDEYSGSSVKLSQVRNFYGSMMDRRALDSYSPDAYRYSESYRRKLGFHSQDRGRAYYSNRQAYVHADDAARTVVHELGHAIENSFGGKNIDVGQPRSRFQEMAREFLRHRAGGTRTTQIYREHPDELGWHDEFIHHYMGKKYYDDTEILSMGFEMLFAEPAVLWANDPEYFWFIVGLLRGEL